MIDKWDTQIVPLIARAKVRLAWSPGTYQDFRWIANDWNQSAQTFGWFRELTGYSELLFLAEVIVVGIEVVWTGRCKLRRFRNFCSCMVENPLQGTKKPSCWAKTSDNPGFEICTANPAQNKAFFLLKQTGAYLGMSVLGLAVTPYQAAVSCSLKCPNASWDSRPLRKELNIQWAV